MKKTRFVAWAILTLVSVSTSVFAAEKADAAVMRVFRGLEQNQAQALWQALPASYQADVTALVHGVAANADEQLWNGTFRILGKLVRVLDEKRDFIFQQPMVAAKLSETEGSDKAYDAVVQILRAIVTSDLSDLTRLRKMDVEAFLAGPISEVMRQADALAPLAPESAQGVESLRSSKATLVSQDGDRAVVRIETPDSTKEQEFTLVEGKWIPSDMATEWKAKVEEFRAQLSQIPNKDNSEQTAQLLLAMAPVEQILDTALAAQTEEEFSGAVQQLVGMVMMQFAGAMGSEEGDDHDQ